VREGDTLVVTRLDRLARSTLHLCQIADELKRRAVALQVLDQNINTGDATGRLLFNMLGAIAQFEQRFEPNDNWMGFGRRRSEASNSGQTRN
jgi:DNA invertase Pin-like site-specific DNA recombinase